MTKSQVTAFAPATIANVGPGFDIFGLALNAPGDQVLVKKSSIPGIRITRITGDQGRLPYDITKNSAGVTALAFCNSLGLENERLEIEIYKGMPLGSGLGSSAASAVATVKALNALYGNPHSETTLLEFAKEGERVACGTPHLDNIAPSLFGGFVFVQNDNPINIIKIPYPKELYFTVITPDIEIRTEEARSILPETIPLTTAVKHSQNVATMLMGLVNSDCELLKNAFVDLLAQPYRSKAIPHFEELLTVAKEKKTLGFGLSGSGPTLFAASLGKKIAEDVANGMRAVFEKYNEDSKEYISSVNVTGAIILSEK